MRATQSCIFLTNRASLRQMVARGTGGLLRNLQDMTVRPMTRSVATRTLDSVRRLADPVRPLAR